MSNRAFAYNIEDMRHSIFRSVRCLLVSASVFCTALSVSASDRPIVSAISAYAGSGRRISVSWTLPPAESGNITSLLVFRDTKPISSYSHLASLSPAAELGSRDTGWSDTAGDYRDYYYAVIAVTGKTRFDIIIPSMNATVNGVHLKIARDKTASGTAPSEAEKLYPAGAMREIPLPYIDLMEGMNSSKPNLSKAADEAGGRLGSAYSSFRVKPLEPYVFQEDLVSPDGGDDYFLFESLKTCFIRRKYTDSIASLQKLLGTNRSEGVTRRAGFYLAESYYFSGDYRNAVTSFLKVSDEYPVLAKKWIDSSLDLMAPVYQ